MLLTAHRELEKLVLTGKQARIKELVAQPYGDLVHEGQHLEPVCRDIEALLASSQERATGEVRLLLRPGQVFVEGALWRARPADEGSSVGRGYRVRVESVDGLTLIVRAVPPDEEEEASAGTPEKAQEGAA